MQTFIDRQKTELLRKFHTLLRRAGITADEKMAMLSAYGVESSKDLNVYELTELCGKIDRMNNPASAEIDRLRKRVMASISNYLYSKGKECNADIIKAIACRATGYETFNKIPKERLRNIIATFNNKVRDATAINNAIVTGFKHNRYEQPN